MKKSLECQVKKVLVEYLQVDPDIVRPEAELVNDLGEDSLDRLEVVMALEEDFEVTIPEDRWACWKSVQDICHTLRGLKNLPAAA